MTKKLRTVLEYAIYVIVLVAVIILVPKYVMEKITVDGSSMNDTLINDEHVLIEKVSRYFSGPKRFDIIVFQKPNGTKSKTYIKRVIGLPGETIQIVGSTIYINGTPLEESYGKSPIAESGIAENEITLDKDEYFVLGDNRAVSIDSRDKRVGIVKKNELDGVVFFRIYPLKKLGFIK